MPLPSSWKELRCRPEPPPKPASSRCSLPPLPEEAMLLWGERGAWSGAGPLAVLKSSWDSQTWPRGWLLGPLMGGVRDTERFRGLCCWLPPPLVRTARQQQDSSGRCRLLDRAWLRLEKSHWTNCCSLTPVFKNTWSQFSVSQYNIQLITATLL